MREGKGRRGEGKGKMGGIPPPFFEILNTPLAVDDDNGIMVIMLILTGDRMSMSYG